MLKKHKYLIASTLAILIIIISVLIYIERDTIFLHRIEIQYGDSCIERYDNGVLMTPECTEGRRLEAEYNGRQNKYPEWTNLNLTFLK